MADTNENERMEPDEDLWCREQNFICTRLMGHEGDHVAHTMPDRVVARWEADRKAADYDRLAGENARREQIAAQVMLAYIAKGWQPHDAASVAVKYADALLAALAKPREET